MTADVFTALHFSAFRRRDLNRQILAVIIINDILHDNIKTAGSSLVVLTVVMIIDGNEANSQERKNPFQVVTQLNIITSESGKVFHYDTVDGTVLDLFQQSLKGRPLEIGATVSIIEKLILFTFSKLRITTDKILDQSFLV